MHPLLTFYCLCSINPQKILDMLRNYYHPYHVASGTMARYFYHPDHIGSSSWITDGTGQAIQHLHDLPFGEDWVDQRNSSWNAPYTFSGKEKDAETGYGYFGARYYDSGLSIWLSVDPMSDKYPSTSPYAYCRNNPILLIDPNGLSDINYVDIDNNVVGTDGNEKDTRTFLVFGADFNKVKADKDAGRTTSLDNIESPVQIVDNKTMNKVLDFYEKSDENNNAREYCGLIYTDNPYSDPSSGFIEGTHGTDVRETLAADYTSCSPYAVDRTGENNWKYAFAVIESHSHLSYGCKDFDLFSCVFKQTPTKETDYPNLRTHPKVKTSYIFMMGSKNVYFMTPNMKIAGKCTFSQFRNLGPKK